VTAALQRETTTIPIVFAVVADPVGAGFVASLSHPAGNITGFSNVEERLIGKWLDLLKQMVPRIKQAGFMLNPDTAPGGEKYLGSFEAAARSLRIEPIILRVRSDAQIDASISLVGRQQGGLVAMTDSFLAVHRKAMIDAALRYGVPAITDIAEFAKEGGLIAYGPTNTDMLRRAARHIDRILRGAKPADLPVELPTQFKMVINVRTAKALGTTVPNTLLALADEVIE
jgi:putative ABC transport system substrate-binding protein